MSKTRVVRVGLCTIRVPSEQLQGTNAKDAIWELYVKDVEVFLSYYLPDPPPREAVALSIAESPPKTKCKHGRGACRKCGTSDNTDTLHTTVKGRGRVARINWNKP